MSPERIRNEGYSYPADIWSLGLALFECGTGEFPYTSDEGPVNLMLQVIIFIVYVDLIFFFSVYFTDILYVSCICEMLVFMEDIG